ncbi:hypothetical protein VMCG_04887 [Cytospora schulzeri]|uniref:Extracellular membrane protein CFEM domain-containing protein n=1 Tax=Cytospora schulzeri TaxID=448051 RepID=A0A423WNK9_9PEZI|nr:hypothetical protein VMCG_04887 [Valsa malicola]
MKFLALIPFLAIGTLAADCGNILPSCSGGYITGQTSCPCKGQAATCDLWICPESDNKPMVCGQSSTGCVWI